MSNDTKGDSHAPKEKPLTLSEQLQDLETADVPTKQVEAFVSLFTGNREAFGQAKLIGEAVEGEKHNAKCYTATGRVEAHHYIKHLFGEQGLGIIPIDKDGNVRFCVIDVDVYEKSVLKYIRMVSASNLPLVPIRSKSGGLHLYMFFSSPVSAKTARDLLERIRIAFGLPDKTELFPKQAKLENGGAGNWINLPYFDIKGANSRYAYDSNGNALSFDDFLARALSSRTSEKDVVNVLDAMPLSDAPPCLQTIFLEGAADKGQRNIFMFNVATYLKAVHKEGFIRPLLAINAKLPAPLDDSELYTTVIKSHEKNEYSYQCNDGVLSGHCNRKLCFDRKYGKDSSSVSNLSFENLIQVKSAKPYYLWTINGSVMQFNDETQLTDQQHFRRLCLRNLHVFPNRLKDDKWVSILNRALRNIEIQAIDQLDDMSDNVLWIETFKEYLQRARAVRVAQIDDGLVYVAGKKVYLKGPLLLAYLKNKTLLRLLSNADHSEMLKALGGKAARVYCEHNKKQYRAWVFNADKLRDSGIDIDEPIFVDDDFSDFKEPLYDDKKY